jgi:hypothetical protein
MPESLISALAQIPCVLAVIYMVRYLLVHLEERDEAWREFIEARDEMMARQLADITRAVERLSGLMLTHDALVRGKDTQVRPLTEERVPVVRGGR